MKMVLSKRLGREMQICVLLHACWKVNIDEFIY